MKILENSHKPVQYLLFGLFFLFLFSACAYDAPVEACLDGEPFGFWHGLMHGFISPISFIISLFKEDVAIYAVNNNGNWYNFGFLFGASMILGGGSKASCGRRKK